MFMTNQSIFGVMEISSMPYECYSKSLEKAHRRLFYDKRANCADGSSHVVIQNVFFFRTNPHFKDLKQCKLNRMVPAHCRLLAIYKYKEPVQGCAVLEMKVSVPKTTLNILTQAYLHLTRRLIDIGNASTVILKTRYTMLMIQKSS